MWIAQFVDCGTVVGPFATFDDAADWAETIDVHGEGMFEIAPVVQQWQNQPLGGYNDD